MFGMGGAIGAGIGGQVEIAVPLGVTGAICMAIGGALVKLDGGTLPKVSLAGSGMPLDNPAADASLDKLMQQANRLEKEAGPADRYGRGSNLRETRTYARSTQDAQGQAKRYAQRMRARGNSVKVPPVRYGKYGHSDVTVKVMKDGRVIHIRHFIYVGHGGG